LIEVRELQGEMVTKDEPKGSSMLLNSELMIKLFVPQFLGLIANTALDALLLEMVILGTILELPTPKKFLGSQTMVG